MAQTKVKLAHTPVLLQEVIQGLELKNGDIVCDATLGIGGHSEEILKRITPNGQLYAIDTDSRNIMLAKDNLKHYLKNIKIIQDNFVNIKKIAEIHNVQKFDAILLDLGLSSPHLDDANRGFSYKNDGPLDMRFDQNQILDAKTIVNSYSEKDLANIIFKFGEDRNSKKIAKIIIENRKKKKFYRTRELATVLENKIKHYKKHPAILTFQALRIAVNNELEVLQDTLINAVELLSYGRRLAVISYHSLEDRIVKHSFRNHARHCICPKEFPLCTCDNKPSLKIITKRPITPSEDEINLNPRARSAKLRIAERI